MHLAARAGVRYSLENPFVYLSTNILGTLNVLEGCRHNAVEHLVYASTSSVYGANTHMPFSVHQLADHPLSLYAATKRSNELMAHNYSALFKIPVTGLRFFTVYGPWGLPDMALFMFTRNILEGKPIDVFNHGHHKRDFTFVEDIAEGVVRAWSQSKYIKLTEDAAPVTLPYHPGCRLVFGDGTPDILAYPQDRKGWGHLCRMLTQANLREETEKGKTLLKRSDLLEWGDLLSLAVLPDGRRAGAPAPVRRQRRVDRRASGARARHPADGGGLRDARGQ